jgi:hypothetical protein
MDMAYVPPYAAAETRKAFKRRVYDVLVHMEAVKHNSPELRIVRKFTGIPWGRIWKNLHASTVPDTVKSEWFAAVRDIVPTTDRLAANHLKDSSSCSRCGEPDSIQHKINECGEGRLIWIWTRARLGMILLMDPRHIPPDRTIRPAFPYYPPQRQTALLWIVAHLVYYRLQSSRRLSLMDFIDFLRRARWMAYYWQIRPTTGRYLDLL